MKKLILLGLAVSTFSIYLSAQSKSEKIKELLSLMQSEKIIDKTFDNMLQVMKQQNTNEFSEKQQNELLTFTMSEMKVMIKKIINEDYPDIYDKYFTEKEIEILINFYKSVTGQKFINQSPEIQKELLSLMMTKYMPDIQQKIEQKKEELKNK